MKKNMSILFFGIMIFFSCGEKVKVEDAVQGTTTETTTQNATTENTTTESTSSTKKEFTNEELLGNYVGMFRAHKYDEKKKPTWANKISISIDKIEGNKVKGHSVVAGNDRPFTGSIQMKDGENYSYVIEGKEPGDDKYDGVFYMTLLPADKKLEGTWVANNSKLSVTERKYTLSRMDFKYDPELSLEEFGFDQMYGTYNQHTGESEIITENVSSKNASTDELTKADVENMHKGDLEVMRNAIYARHGYSFKNRKMRYVFNHIDWYVPYSTDIRDQLTDLEKKNIDLLKRYENHAERYYDSFGR